MPFGPRKKRRSPEHSLQSKLVDITNQEMRPELIRLAIPNGGMRHPIVGRMLKAEGLLPGSPDLVWAMEQARVLWMELKSENGSLSDEQIGMHFKLRELGHTVEVAYSFDEAMDLLQHYGILR